MQFEHLGSVFIHLTDPGSCSGLIESLFKSLFNTNSLCFLKNNSMKSHPRPVQSVDQAADFRDRVSGNSAALWQ